jgi:hypothetical protein
VRFGPFGWSSAGNFAFNPQNAQDFVDRLALGDTISKP